MPNRAQIDDGEITSFEVDGIIPHALKMDQEQWLPCFSIGPQKHCCHFVRSGRV
jgi:hypothetical protein